MWKCVSDDLMSDDFSTYDAVAEVPDVVKTGNAHLSGRPSTDDAESDSAGSSVSFPRGLKSTLNPEAMPYQPLNERTAWMELASVISSEVDEQSASTKPATAVKFQDTQFSSTPGVNNSHKTTDSRATISKTHTWKSEGTKLSAEYKRLQKLINHIAPEQFRNPAKPTNGPCEIVPTCLREYIQHRRAISDMAKEQMQKNIAWKRLQQHFRDKHGRIRSAFDQPGYVFGDGLSPVLALPTIWSAEYHTCKQLVANWPTQSELQCDGDTREQLATRCGRFLPAPRVPPPVNSQPYNQPFLQPLPLDQTGPIYTHGPSPLEIAGFNSEVSNDPEFEKKGAAFLGPEMMKEIGHWAAPFVPDWVRKDMRAF